MERHVWKNLDINTGIKAGQLIFFILFFYQLGPDGLSLRSSHWSSVRILFLLIQAWHEQIPFSFITASIWRQGCCHGASVALFSDRDGHVTKKKTVVRVDLEHKSLFFHFFVDSHLQKCFWSFKELRGKLPANWVLLQSQPMQTAPPHLLIFFCLSDIQIRTLTEMTPIWRVFHHFNSFYSN